MFDLSPLVVRAIGIALIAAAGFAGGWAVNGWRLGTEVAHLETRVIAAVAQGEVLAGAVKACNAGVAEAKVAGDQARELGAAMLFEAQRIGAPAKAQADRLERLLKQAPPPGAGCPEAWAQIEQDQKAGASR